MAPSLTELDVYLDAPYLQPPFFSSHNQHSYPLHLKLSGPISFLDDGRMQITQANGDPLTINVNSSRCWMRRIGGRTGYLTIGHGDNVLNSTVDGLVQLSGTC